MGADCCQPYYGLCTVFLVKISILIPWEFFCKNVTVEGLSEGVPHLGSDQKSLKLDFRQIPLNLAEKHSSDFQNFYLKVCAHKRQIVK